MIYKLPQPDDLGLTHADVHLDVFDAAIFVRGHYGRMKGKTFAPETRVQPLERVISGKELDAFLAGPVDAGLPKEKRGDFRRSDLTAWLDKYGHSQATKTWTDPEDEE